MCEIVGFRTGRAPITTISRTLTASDRLGQLKSEATLAYALLP